jgi:hypothetical protein
MNKKNWTYFVRLVGVIMFLAPLYLPIQSYLFENVKTHQMDLNDIGFSLVGFFLFAGGKNLGTLANNIGVALNNLVNKFSK